jgi:NAD+ diphosphatase
VIVLVKRGDEILLARSGRFERGLFSVLAGFVEPGETLEEAVAREVREEVGISISHITYFGSQPWPFPDSLMVGFTAEYLEGDLHIDGEEIVEAGWYRVGNLPVIPDKVSIARRLIDSFVPSYSDESM